MPWSRPIRFLLVAAALLAACGESAPRVEPADGGVRTVVLVTIDTWRWDANGFLGGPAGSPTPFLDQLAASGFVAIDAVAAVPLTGPSHWSILTGRWPWADGLRTNGDRPRQGTGPTLAETLRARGWETAAFVSCAVLDHRFGFARGFETFDDRIATAGGSGELSTSERRGDETLDAARRWIRQQDAGKKLFLWVHLFDPHFPYASPAGAFPGEHGGYLGEVAFADAQVHALAEGLEAGGRPWRDILWVILSDHGEALGEHGERTHGLLLHGATTRIPLLVFGPSIPVRRYAPLVSTVDVVPTLLGYLGLEGPEADGRDLLGPTAVDDRSVPLESMFALRAFGLPPAVGLRQQHWLWEASPEDHLWDLRSDPHEHQDLSAGLRDKVGELRQTRAAFGVPELVSASEIPAELQSELRSLGYVSGGIAAETRSIRRFVKTDAEWHFQVLSLEQQGDFAQAERYARKFLRRNPRSPAMWIEAGFIALRLGDLGEAEGRFRRAAELDPSDPQAHLNLANVLVFANRQEEAEEEYRKVLQIDGEDHFALFNLGALLARLKRHREAADTWKELLRLYPQHPRAPEVQTALRQWMASGMI